MAREDKKVSPQPRRQTRGDHMSAQPEGAIPTTGATTRPFTGDEYLESLDDGREIWIYGERVANVATHPAFRNTARMIARLYDSLHDPARNKKIVVPTDTGSNGYTHAFFKAPYTVADLQQGADAITEWAR